MRRKKIDVLAAHADRGLGHGTVVTQVERPNTQQRIFRKNQITFRATRILGDKLGVPGNATFLSKKTNQLRNVVRGYLAKSHNIRVNVANRGCGAIKVSNRVGSLSELYVPTQNSKLIGGS